MSETSKTLTRHTIEMEHRHPDTAGDFSGLLNAVAAAVRMITNQVDPGAFSISVTIERVGGFGSRAEVEVIQRYHRAHTEPGTDDFSLFNTRSLFRA